MAARKKSEEQVVRVAPLGELRAYTISEHELEKLEQGTSVPDLLTIGLCLLSAAVTILAKEPTVSAPPGRGITAAGDKQSVLVTGQALARLSSTGPRVPSLCSSPEKKLPAERDGERVEAVIGDAPQIRTSVSGAEHSGQDGPA